MSSLKATHACAEVHLAARAASLLEGGPMARSVYGDGEDALLKRIQRPSGERCPSPQTEGLHSDLLR